MSGITTILPIEIYGYYQAIGGMAAVKYTFMGDSAVSGGKASQTTAMKVDSVTGVQGVSNAGAGSNLNRPYIRKATRQAVENRAIKIGDKFVDHQLHLWNQYLIG